jgi:hypothetical protein
VRSPAPAGPLADAFLDVTRSSALHAVPVGAADVPHPDVPHPDVPGPAGAGEPGGFSSVQVERPGDRPDAAAVPEAPRRRITHRFRAPFQLLLRLEDLDAGTVRTVLFLLQPEDADSTRVHTCLLLSDGGAAVPPDVVAAEVAHHEAARAGGLALLAAMRSSGLPLLLRDELHVRADRLGVELRRALADLVADCATPHGVPDLEQRASA